MIRAFRKVSRQYLDSRLWIVGDGDYKDCFEEANPIFSQVTLTGFLDRASLLELYRVADVGVVPSLFEPFGYVPVEMMMHGLPVVATATSGLDEVVDDSCGLKVPLAVSADRVEIDADQLAEKILFCCGTRRRRGSLGGTDAGDLWRDIPRRCLAGICRRFMNPYSRKRTLRKKLWKRRNI